jgi:hypothetical protein
MEVLKKIWNYLIFSKKNEDNGSMNLKFMHGINRISIFMFLIGVTYLVVRAVFFR